VVLGVLALAVVLAFGVRGLLAARVVQARATALIRAGNFAQALDEADLRLSRDADDPHLVEVAVLAARSHVGHLLETGTPVPDVAAWLEAAAHPASLPASRALRTAGRTPGGGETRRPPARKKLGGSGRWGE
jgi:hypothetical protein